MDLDYLNTKSILATKALDLAETLQHIDEQMDELYKINFYLLRRYKDDLIAEFDLDEPSIPPEWTTFFGKLFNQETSPDMEALRLTQITAAIKQEMKEEMPNPWYYYSFGGMIE